MKKRRRRVGNDREELRYQRCEMQWLRRKRCNDSYQKVQEKIDGKEPLYEIRNEMSSVLMNGAYDIYIGQVQKYGGKVNTYEELEELLEGMLNGVTMKKGITAKKKELEKEGQKENKTVQVWGNRVRTEMQRIGAVEYTMAEVFITGLKDKKVQRKVQANVAMMTMEMDLETAINEAGRVAIYYESKGELNTPRKKYFQFR